MSSLSLPIYLFFLPANPSDFSSFPGRLPAGMTVSLWAVARIPLRSRNDARSPEKSLFAAQSYFFDHFSDCAIFNLELGLQPLRLPRRGCRKNIHSRSELLSRILRYLNFAHGQRRSPKSQETPGSFSLKSQGVYFICNAMIGWLVLI